MLNGKKILIGISGGIAAYKIPLLVRLLVKAGAEVKVILSPVAKDFVTPLTLSTVSKNPVYCLPFDSESGSWNSHVELGLWADLFLIAPATANTMAKMVTGIADNFLTTTYLSARCPVMLAPAMDLDMYKHPTVQHNIASLEARAHYIIKAGTGELASGLSGEGRMEEPEEIFKHIEKLFSTKLQFEGKNVLITAGPTYEAIAPVRFIGNHSSGRMGFELAEAFAEQGAKVHLISGPTHLQTKHPHINRIDVISADEMAQQAISLFDTMDIAVMSAAVADFKPAQTVEKKIKKKDKALSIHLVPTTDILYNLGLKKGKNQLLVGFALETDNAVENAISKLHNKNADFIVLNSLEDEGAGFGHATNKISIINAKEEITQYPLKQKRDAAADILDVLAAYLESNAQ